ncbi:MAG: amidohydrolase family protein [Alphaproteobacteria bacterium]|nr:amidohydrolase family protein [Alphaproteobacteria bacterium]
MPIPCTPDLRWRLIESALENAAPDLLIRGGKTWNAYTGEVEIADIAICGDRIAKVGTWSAALDAATSVIDATGMIAVPGYIEPHTHLSPFCSPLSFAERAVCHGVSCVVFDQLMLALPLGPEVLERVTTALSQASLPLFFWLARTASQSRFRDEEAWFGPEIVRRQLESPSYLGTVEMTRWTELLDKRTAMRFLEVFEQCRSSGKLNDGHFAGARTQKLAALATTGIRSCHEAITTEEALDRLRLGLWVLLRHSSLRPDLPVLLDVIGKTRFHDRLVFTTDGATELRIDERGVSDGLISLALERGVAPDIAYRMATLNPATYLGLDDDLGAVAPGRIANVNLLDNLNNPTPRVVICRGRVAARDRQLTVPAPSASFPWSAVYRTDLLCVPAWDAARFFLPADAPNPFPAGRLVNGAITRVAPTALTASDKGLWPSEPDTLVLAVTDRSGAFISRGIIQGMGAGIDVIATSYTTNAGILVLGRTPEIMAEALKRLRRLGGGSVAASTDGKWVEFAFSMSGIHSTCDFSTGVEAARRFSDLLREAGYAHSDPVYTLLFLTADFLPEVRATEAGWYSVKDDRVLFPAESLSAP